MDIIDIHAYIYERVAGIIRGQPMPSTGLGWTAIGNEEVQSLPPPFEQSRSTAEMLIAYMDWCGIEKAVLMPNPYYGYHDRYFTDNVRRHPSRLRDAALVDIMKGQEVTRELASICNQGVLFGFKMEVDGTFQCAPGTHLTDSRPAPVWDCCNQYHQPVFIHMLRTEDIEDMEVLASAYPNICFVLYHMGADACFKRGIPESDYRQMLDLVKNRPNISIDISTVPVYFDEEYLWPSPMEIIQIYYRHVGPGRMMWASDYPGMLGHGTMRQLINLVEKYCNHIPESHRQMTMADNARRLFFDNQKQPAHSCHYFRKKEEDELREKCLQ